MENEKGIEIPTKYCSHCGAQMKYMGMLGAEKFYGSKYDERTGKRRLKHWIACPNIYKKRFGFLDYPDYFMHDSHSFGDTVLEEAETS